MEFPIQLVVDMFNGLPKENTKLRGRILEYLRTYKEKVKPKGHAVEGLLFETDGSLAFDAVLYTEAVFRGKINTYATKLLDTLKQVQRDVRMLSAMDNSHREALAAVASEALEKRLGIGLPISEEEAYLVERSTQVLKALAKPAPRKRIQARRTRKVAIGPAADGIKPRSQSLPQPCRRS
jgi:hypothetical protein